MNKKRPPTICVAAALCFVDETHFTCFAGQREFSDILSHCSIFSSRLDQGKGSAEKRDAYL